MSDVLDSLQTSMATMNTESQGRHDSLAEDYTMLVNKLTQLLVAINNQPNLKHMVDQLDTTVGDLHAELSKQRISLSSLQDEIKGLKKKILTMATTHPWPGPQKDDAHPRHPSVSVKLRDLFSRSCRRCMKSTRSRSHPHPSLLR